MSNIPEFKKVYATNNITLVSKNKVECKLPILEEDAQNILKINLSTSLNTIECLDKEIKYSGRGLFTVLYKSENTIKNCEVGVEYSFKFPSENAVEGNNVLGKINVNKCSVSTLNGIVIATATIEFLGEMYKNVEIETFDSNENLLVKNKEIDYIKDVCKFQKEHKLEDEFDLPILIGNVLSHEESVVISEVQCGIGGVILDGEVEVNGIVMPLSGEVVPTTFCKKIPFRIECECEEAIPNFKAIANACVKNANLKVYVDENKNKSAVSLEVNLIINGILFEELKLNLLVDVYSLQNKLKVNKEDKKICNLLNFKCLEFNQNEKLNVKLQENARLNTVLSAKIEEKDISFVNGNIIVSGTISACVFEGGEDFLATDVLIPFSVESSINASEVVLKDVLLVSCSQVVKDDELFLNYTLKVMFVEIHNDCFNTIKSIDVLEEMFKNDSAISVYIPSCGDTLWDICKALCLPENAILEMNKDLEFPLNGDERIVVYREINSK